MGLEEQILQVREHKGWLAGHKQGRIEGKEEQKIAFIIALLRNTDLTDEMIAHLTEANQELVLSIRNALIRYAYQPIIECKRNKPDKWWEKKEEYPADEEEETEQ